MTLSPPEPSRKNLICKGPVEAELLFYHPPADNSSPFYYVDSAPPGQVKCNFQELPHKIQLSDIRNEKEKNLQVSKHGVQILQNVPTSTVYETYASDEEIKRLYYPEIKKLLLENLPGSKKVIIFDHTIRRQNPSTKRKPLYRAHVDQSSKAAAERVRMEISSPMEAESIINGACRYRIVNVWRPINGAVESNPLAFADVSTIDEDRDLVPVEFRHPHRTGEILLMNPHPDHKWMYLSGVKEDERLLLQCFDSDAGPNERGKRLPHTAFWDPRTPHDAKERESIEVRALILG
ncbi:hypothetical protein N7493_000871 [Penicillium malachiteum]|uniref:Methyltransferase n=1 Tax=Penicillium malachiteum TaxID=1324776 RepID=A0AAD6HYB0_9EURO|nr:hypothetical protein N7493_000871 [Penicillium malachiteum]